MGFNGGGGGGTLPHKHSNIANDGSPLDMSNITVGSLAQGSVVFSNGLALQELVKPAVPAGEVLSYPALAVAPSWAAAGGGLTNTNRQVISGMTNLQTTTSSVFVNPSGVSSATLQNVAGGSAFIYFSYCCENSSIGTGGICVQIGGVDTSQVEEQSAPSNYRNCISGCGAMAATNGDTVQCRWRTNSGTRTMYNEALRESLCQIFEIY